MTLSIRSPFHYSDRLEKFEVFIGAAINPGVPKVDDEAHGISI